VSSAAPSLLRSGSLAGLAERAASNHVPLQALLEVTGRCHLDCVHCYLDVKQPPRDELSTEEIVCLLDQLKAAGVLFLTVTGGEIFLRRDILDIVAAARQRRFAVRLFTSGTLLTRQLVAEIARLRPVAVEISVYGLHARVHDRVTRRSGSLRKSLRAAVLLRQAGVAVALKSPLLANTDGGHFDLIDAARRIGAGYRIDPSLISRRDGGVEPLAARPPIETVTRLYQDRRLADPEQALPPPRPAGEAPCAIARRVVRIAPNGDVYACSAFPIAAGNVREASFADIWYGSPLLRQIRGITVGDLEGECQGCARQGYCGRCSAQALLEYGNFKGPTGEACNRAEARERAAGVSPPPGAQRMAERAPMGRRPLGSFVPLTALRPRS
jgi:AdoMet-dependent heme synthase